VAANISSTFLRASTSGPSGGALRPRAGHARLLDDAAIGNRRFGKINTEPFRVAIASGGLAFSMGAAWLRVMNRPVRGC
jgi:hypothetical protein